MAAKVIMVVAVLRLGSLMAGCAGAEGWGSSGGGNFIEFRAINGQDFQINNVFWTGGGS